MRKIGYARVSTRHQNLARQVEALKEEGCVKIFSDTASGKSLKDRPQLALALAELKKGDVFVVAEWDRATRSSMDGHGIMAKVHQSDATIKVLDRQGLQLDTPLGRAVLGVISAMYEEDRERICRRADQGRRLAMKRGVQFGPKKRALSSAEAADAVALYGEVKSYRKVGDAFGVSHGTIANLVKAANG